MIARVIKKLLLLTVPNRYLLQRGPRTGNAVYLTFDDGPHPQFTPPLLDLLAEHGVKATFFMIGDQVGAHVPIVQRMAAEGHRLGNHSWDHPRFLTIDFEQQWQQVEDTDAALAGCVREQRIPFRPPRGDVSFRLLWRLIRRGRTLVHWSYDSLDYSRQPADGLIARLRDKPPVPGDIVLLHDDGGAAIEILRVLLPEWRARGLSFAALPEEVC